MEHHTRFAAVLGYAFFVLISFPTIINLPGDVSLGHATMLLGLPVWIAAVADRGFVVFDDLGRFVSTVLLTCCGLLILYAIMTAFFAENPFRASRTILSLVTAFAVFALINGTINAHRLTIYLSVLSLALTVACLIGIAAFFEPSLQARTFWGDDRTMGFFKNPNQFGIAISTVLPISMALLLASRNKLFWTLATAILVGGLIATGSKTNILISSISLLVVPTLYCFIAYDGPKRLGMIAFSLLIYAMSVFAGFTTLYMLNPRALSLLQRFFGGEQTHSLESREVLWSSSIETFMQQPFGVGAGQMLLPHVAHSHNVVLEFARTMGVPGLVLILIFLGVTFYSCVSVMVNAIRARRADPRIRALCLGTAIAPLAYTTSNLASDSFGPTTVPFFYIPLFLSLACHSLLLRE